METCSLIINRLHIFLLFVILLETFAENIRGTDKLKFARG
jgi:hypothetical protein